MRKTIVLGQTIALLVAWTMLVCADGRSTDESLHWRTHWALERTLAGRIHTANWRHDGPGRLILDAMLSKVVSHRRNDGHSGAHYTCKALMMRLQRSITHTGHSDVTKTLA